MNILNTAFASAPLKLAVVIFAMLSVLASPATAQFAPSPGSEAASEAESPPTPSETLLELLRDDTARAALIEELEITAAATTPETLLEPEAFSIGRQLAEISKASAERAVNSVQTFMRALGNAPDLFEALTSLGFADLSGAFGDLLLLIVATIAIYLGLRSAAIPIYKRMGQRARGASVVRRIPLLVGSGLIDGCIVFVAWGIGYVIALTLLGTWGEIGLRQTLYLNAFLVVELLRTALRLLLSPTTRDLRVFALGDAAARALSRVLGLVIALIGYGQLLIVPIANQEASFAAGRGISLLISIAAILTLAGLVVRHRRGVTDWLLHETRPLSAPLDDATFDDPDPLAADEIDPELSAAIAAGTADPPPRDHAPITSEVPGQRIEDFGAPIRRRGFMASFAGIWHWVALSYLGIVLLTVLVNSGGDALGPVFNSIKVAASVVLGLMLSGALARAIVRGIVLPQNIRDRLPMLEMRLNRIVLRGLFLLRLVILGAVILFALHTLGIVDVGSWFDSPVGRRIIGAAFSVLAILLVALALWLALTSWVDYRLNPDFGSITTSRETTLLTLLRNAATIALIVVTFMFALSEIGLNIGPLLASAGVLGLAIGFGSQKMVQDIIGGIFIQFENAINVGDVVTVAGTTGVVERLTVRSVSLRDVHGVFHIVPFSSVDMVSNFMRDFSFFVCDMGVSYRESVEEVKQAMFDAFDELRQDPEHAPTVLGDLEWFGLNTFDASALVMRARIKTIPGKQWGVGRAYNAIVKRIFDERGIEIPFPHQTIHFAESKDGKTQPLRVLGDDDQTEDRGGGN